MKLLSKASTVISILAICVVAGTSTAGASALGQGSAGSRSSAAVQTTGSLGTPDNFRLRERTGSQLRFDWDWLSGTTSTTRYELSYAGKTVAINHYYPGHTQDVSDLDLSPGHAYTFRLWAVDAAGSRSAVPAKLAFETTPPTPSSNLKQLSTKMGYPDLISFDHARDNASPIRAYEVFVDGRSFGNSVGSLNNQFSLFRQVFESYTSVPVGYVPVQVRAYDASLNASQLSAPLMVVFP